MRKYIDFPEARNEIKRDLAELGIRVHTETMQDKQIADNPDFETRELQNYSYEVLKPDYSHIEGTHDEWVTQEWADRLQGGLNPGRAWTKRKDVWDQFLERHKPKMPGRFSYTYSERMGGQYLRSIVDELKVHPNSRQLYLPVWSNQSDWKRRGRRRVPCSLGYWFVMRGGDIHLTYMMRSCDFYTHYPNDVALASIMQAWVAKETDYGVGTFTHFIGSFHVYAKDVADVF
jgi:thymidylate synthase